MVCVERLVETLLGHAGGRLQALPDGNLHLLPDTLDGIGIEARMGQHGAGAVERDFQDVGFGQTANAHPGHVTQGAAAKLDATLLQAQRQGVGIPGTGTLAQQRIGETRQAGQATVARAARIEDHPRVQHRQIRGIDEQDPGALAGLPGGDLGAGLNRTHDGQEDQAEQNPNHPDAPLQPPDAAPAAPRAAASGSPRSGSRPPDSAARPCVPAPV